MNTESFLVCGAGSWGTALSIQLYKAGNKVFLTSFDETNLSKTKTEKENKKYLPGVEVPEGISIGPISEEAIARSTSILICVKSPGFIKTINLLGPAITNKKIVWATKWFNHDNGSFFSGSIEGMP